ncbi:GTP cyclohydrolase II-domain-containing protein [Rhizoctonia solani]|nr:GTP cyclohydrolase II-domain-containing protein [Rhizoctonia solani]
MTMTAQSHFETIASSDIDMLNALTSPTVPRQSFRRRDAPFDPLLFAAAISTGPHVTRHHYHHDFHPMDEESMSPEIGSYAHCDDDSRPQYVSRQKPRRERLRELGVSEDGQAAVGLAENVKMATSPILSSAVPSKRRRSSILPSADPTPAIEVLQLQNPLALAPLSASSQTLSRGPVVVQCKARTRIPTPHGPAFLHLYHNNWDAKEHMAIVIDPAQLNQDEPMPLPPIRSQSLDAVWREGETETERIVRGAYVGRLSANTVNPSTSASYNRHTPEGVPAPLVRIHSECFTGETIGSMRCDCGEQLDEAMRLIAQPMRIPSTGQAVPGRGAVVYMRQEGRGIGLLEKIRAYNLQDLGHDTVTANLMLGHGADERGYEIAAAILRDLGLGAESNEPGARGVRLLTNNPEKMEALEKEKIRVEQRVGMVPRSWKTHTHSGRARARTITSKDSTEDSDDSFDEHQLRRSGATLIGGGAAHGVELERYLATKVQRMGHMLDLPASINSSSPVANIGLGLVSQAASDDEDGAEVMTKSVGSLPDLEFDSASYSSRSVSPSDI